MNPVAKIMPAVKDLMMKKKLLLGFKDGIFFPQIGRQMPIELANKVAAILLICT